MSVCYRTYVVPFCPWDTRHISDREAPHLLLHQTFDELVSECQKNFCKDYHDPPTRIKGIYFGETLITTDNYLALMQKNVTGYFTCFLHQSKPEPQQVERTVRKRQVRMRLNGGKPYDRPAKDTKTAIKQEEPKKKPEPVQVKDNCNKCRLLHVVHPEHRDLNTQNHCCLEKDCTKTNDHSCERCKCKDYPYCTMAMDDDDDLRGPCSVCFNLEDNKHDNNFWPLELRPCPDCDCDPTDFPDCYNDEHPCYTCRIPDENGTHLNGFDPAPRKPCSSCKCVNYPNCGEMDGDGCDFCMIDAEHAYELKPKFLCQLCTGRHEHRRCDACVAERKDKICCLKEHPGFFEEDKDDDSDEVSD